MADEQHDNNPERARRGLLFNLISHINSPLVITNSTKSARFDPILIRAKAVRTSVLHVIFLAHAFVIDLIAIENDAN